MPFNLDIAIVASFLIINLIVGIYYGRNIKTLKYYAIGDRNFSTTAITATIIATWIGSGFFSSSVSETYENGLWHIVARVGDFITLAIVGFVYAPRMAEFFGKITVCEMMDSLYGKEVRIITAIASIALSIGYIAVQIKVISGLFSYFFGIPTIYAVLFSSVVIIIYSSFGGILSVTCTDLIQLFTFGVFVPVFAFFLWTVFGSSEEVTATLSQHPLFDYHEVFNLSNKSFYASLVLFMYFTLPALDPATCQRILMAKNTTQIRQSFINSSILCLIIGGMACIIGIIALSHNPNMDPNNLLMYVVDNYSFVGLKGVTLIAIMSMGMSTADSYINASAVIFSRDLCSTLGIKLIPDELLLARIFSVLIGIIAVTLVLFSSSNLFELIVLAGNFYTPIITVPLTLAVFGFRSSSRAVLGGIIAGFITVVVWRTFIQDTLNIDSIIPGTFANLIVLLFIHYFLKEPGGWIGIKCPAPLISLRLERKRKIKQLIYSIRNFRLLQFCKSNLPKTEITYTLFAVFVIISTYSSMYTIPDTVKIHYKSIYAFIYHSIFIISVTLLTYPLWPVRLKNENFISITWNLGIFHILVCVGILLIISGFSQIQLMIFILNLVVLSMILRWQVALLAIFTGVFVSINFYKLYVNADYLPDSVCDTNFKIIYLLLLVSIVLIAFLKPKQAYQELTEEKVSQLENLVDDREVELIKSLDMKNEFIRNINHEVHAPVTGIASLGKTLWESYDQLTETQRRNAVETIAKSADRLISLTNNMIDLSKLESTKYDLNIQEVNLAELVIDRVNVCKKLYVGNKTLEFLMNLEDHVICNCDKYYISQTLDNLIINAINYSKEGAITISLRSAEGMAEFSIEDEGVGIPRNDIYDIFEVFIVSSKTKTPAGGRGVGLALCKKVIELHHGKIWAESNGIKGSEFKFVIPSKNC